jgi:serine/threonine protein kinase
MEGSHQYDNLTAAPFVVGAQIARGTFCRVYDTDISQDSPQILKTYKIHRQFARAYRASSCISDESHKYIEHIISYGAHVNTDADTFMPRITIYAIIPRFEIRLSDHLEQCIRATNEGLPAICVIHFARRLFKALQELANSNIVHCDIKPSNIMIRAPPVYTATSITSFETVLCDFGSARFISDSSREYCKPASVGTVPYVAPEILLGKKFTYSADIWSAMLTIFNAITNDSLIDVYNTCNLSYGIDIESVCARDEDEDSSCDEDEDSSRDEDEDSSRDDEDSSSDDENVTHDITFDLMYAHVLILYRLIGAPPESFCNMAKDYYNNGAPRYAYDLPQGTISQFLQENYINLNVTQMQEIERFLTLGIKYMESDRAHINVIMNHPFLRSVSNK